MAAERYFQNDMTLVPELDDAETTRAILKAAAAALKVRVTYHLLQLDGIMAWAEFLLCHASFHQLHLQQLRMPG
jgi:uncharacterized membrane protein